MGHDLDRRILLAVLGGAITSAATGGRLSAQVAATSGPPVPATPPGPPPSSEVLFRNVRVFDGKSPRLSAPTNVLVQGNLIAAPGTQPEPAARVIEGNQRTLMPGLIDCHAHLEFYNLPAADFVSSPGDYLQLRQAPAARAFLMTGFTSVRDAGGPTFGLKRAIDEELLIGPRIWPSGAIISQTSGHGESRYPNELPSRIGGRDLTPHERENYVFAVDGVPEVLEKVREQLYQGASQIKLAVGGGVSSNHDPLDSTQFSEEEIRAAVGAAEDWGTYVMVHGYTPRAVNRALDCGVKSIEHGQLLDEPTIERIAKMGLWLSTQPFLMDTDAIPTTPGSENERKYQQVAAGTERAYALAKKHGVKTAFGTDIQLNPKGAERQPHYLPKLLRWYTPFECLKMATHDNAQLLALSGPRSPYPRPLGVVQPGAYADLLLVNGNPLVDLNVLADPDRNFAVIMKDGNIYKNQDNPLLLN